MSGFCPFCGVQLPPPPPGDAPPFVTCPVCAQEIDAPAAMASLAEQIGRPAPEPTLPSADGPAWQGPAWEGEDGLWARLWRTTWQMLLHPARTLTPPGLPGLKWSLSYGLILGTLATASQLFWSRHLGLSQMSPIFTVSMLVLAPLQVLVSLYLTVAVIHAMLFILGGAKQGYAATFRALAYAQAAGLWILVPLLGMLLALVWGIVISTGALAAVHGIGRGRAFSALMLPFFLGLIILALIGLAVGIGVLATILGTS